MPDVPNKMRAKINVAETQDVVQWVPNRERVSLE